MKKLLVCLCFLALITPPETLADLILQERGVNIGFSTSSDYPAFPQPIEDTITLQRFDPRLGYLEGGGLDFEVFLSRYHKLDIRGCRWGGMWNYFTFFWENDPERLSTPIFKGIDPSTGDVFSTIKPPWPDPDDMPSRDGEQLGFYRECPTYTEFWDYCYEEISSPDVDIAEHVDLDITRFSGVGTIDYEFYTAFDHSSGDSWDGSTPCNGPWREMVAVLTGRAEIKSQYIFSPAVDIFVSDRVSKNILRFRSDGQNIQREIFIAAGEGGLDEPSGIVFTPDGDLLVASRNSDFWNPTGPKILRYDGQTGAFLGLFAEHEQLTNPKNMVYGPDGNLYVLVEESYSLWVRDRVLRFNGQTGEFLDIFAQEPCGYANPNCNMDVAWDLAFGQYGDLYVTSYQTGKVLRFDGTTGEYKDIVIDNVTGVRDIIWPDNSPSPSYDFSLLVNTQVIKYSINPWTKEVVRQGQVFSSSNIAMGASIAMVPKMQLEWLSTEPSIFAAGGYGVFNYSPTGYSERRLFTMGIGSASDVIVRPHIMQTVSRPVGHFDTLIDFSDGGLDVSVQFEDVTGDGTLSLAVSETGPGPDATGFMFLGTYYEFSVHDGLSYTGDVEICIEIPPGTDPADAQIMRWDGSSWQDPLSSSVNGNQICATFPSLSWFGIAMNRPPIAICKNVTVPAESDACNAAATIDDGSYDPDGDEITLEQTPAGPYSLGDTDVTLIVTDDAGDTDNCGSTVTVVDEKSPVISSTSASPDDLWPPNHKMMPVTIAVASTDNCDSACQIVLVESSEPNDSLGDSDTVPDWEIMGDLTVNLRAERSGIGIGRIYTITVECVDSSGNSSSDTATVTVPHDKGMKNKQKNKMKK